MGFAVDFCAIFFGCILGGIFKNKINFKSFFALSVGVMLISAVGLLENILSVSGEKIVCKDAVILCIALIIGYLIGDAMKLEDRIYGLSRAQTSGTSGFIDSVLFFGIGGLQLSGPILYALEKDSLQLIMKGLVDFPFALILGATYGKIAALSAPVVTGAQLIIWLAACLCGNFLSDSLVRQICSIGYIMLFFSGFNMISSPKSKIKNINFLPSMGLVIIYSIFLEVIL